MTNHKLEPLSKHLLSIESGSRPKGGVSKYTEGVPSISAEQMCEDGTFDFETLRYVPKEFFAAAKKGKIKKGDILVVKDGATTGKTVFVGDDFPFNDAMVNEHTFIIRTKPSLLPHFAFFCLRSDLAAECFSAARDHGIIGGLTQSFPNSIEIPILPIPRQKEVLNYLRTLNKQIQQAHQLRNAALIETEYLIAAAISNIIEKTTHRFIHLTNLLAEQPRNGWSPPAEFQNGYGTPVLTLSSVTGFSYNGSCVKYTTAPTQEDAHYWLKPNELLITRSNAPELVGHAAIYDGTPAKVICCDLIMKMKVDPNKADVRFIHYWLQSSSARQFIRQRAKGASGTMQKISKDDVQEIPIPDISVDAQRRIIAHLDDLMAKHLELRKLQNEVSEESDSLLPSLLSQILYGD